MARRLFAGAGRRWLPFIVLLFIGVSPAAAQTATPEPEPDAEATMRFGPFALRSTIALTNVGVDTNVFNAADVENPQSDFTMTFTPTTDWWLRMGRTWINGRVDVDWVYYRRFASERSANSEYAVGVSRTFNRLALKGGARRLATRDRPGFEIDARSQRVETDWDGLVEMRVLAKTYVGAKALQGKTAFDKAAVFRDVNLALELDRTRTMRSVVVRHLWTPLTTVSLEIGREAERYVFSSLRDADSTRMTGTVNFQPLALVGGNATIGYRGYTPLSASVPAFRGLTTAMNLSYRLFGTTRLGLQAARDVQPSFEIDQPYYLESGLNFSAQQQVFGPFDVLGRIGRRRLAYRDRVGAPVDLSNRTDRIREVGIGVGYRLGTDKRFGVTLDRQSRTSTLDGVGYSGARLGVSLTYER